MDGLRMDASIVQQSLQWLGGEKKGREGANGST
jgi:hypothetical protein